MENPSTEHQKLVGALINYFITTLGYEILHADYGNYKTPDRHGRHAPDIVARDKNGILHLAEAKVGSDISSQITKEQFIDFSDRIMTVTRQPVILDVVVYKQDEQLLKSRLYELGLSAKIGSKINIWTL